MDRLVLNSIYKLHLKRKQAKSFTFIRKETVKNCVLQMCNFKIVNFSPFLFPICVSCNVLKFIKLRSVNLRRKNVPLSEFLYKRKFLCPVIQYKFNYWSYLTGI